MRSYGQYCGLAKGLDLIGDRWTLLVVRELLVGPRRYGELLEGLPGIATNLLAERLRSMQEHDLIAKVGREQYALTEKGEGLREVLYAIGRWAYPMMGDREPGDAFRSQWLVHPVAGMFPGVDPARPDVTIEARCGEPPMTIESHNGAVTVREGTAAAPDVVLTGPPDVLVALLAQRVSRQEAARRGLTITGDASALRRLKPYFPAAAKR